MNYYTERNLLFFLKYLFLPKRLVVFLIFDYEVIDHYKINNHL